MKSQDVRDLIGILEALIDELKMIAEEAESKALPINTFKLQQALKQIKKTEPNRAEKLIDLVLERRKKENKQ